MFKNKPLATIFLIVFIDLMGFGLILPLLPFIAERFNATPQHIGLLAATYSLFQFISGPILGRLSDRYGRKKLLVISQMGTFLGFILLAFANSLPLLFLSRIIDGITGGNISIAQAYIADSTDSKNRAKGMGMIGAAFGLGFIIGPTLGGVLSRGGYMLPALVAAGISLLSIIVTIMFLKETVTHNPGSQLSLTQMIKTLKDKRLQEVTIIFFVLNLAFSSMQGIFALWAQVRFGWGAQSTGYLLGFVGLISVISQLKILPLALKNVSELNLLKIGIPLMALGFLMMALEIGRASCRERV
jgi:DHA1 family tetracycline resistance protein-like MFS transporter